MIGCDCPVCSSTDPRNKRSRCSAVFQTPGGNLLIDTATELRLQLIRAGISHISAVLYTHTHADHLFGMDDLRRINYIEQAPVPIYISHRCAEDVRRVFDYVFDEYSQRIPAGGVPKLEVIRINGPFEVAGERVVPIPLRHGRFEVLGFRVGDAAYCTDCNGVYDESWPLLEGLDVLVIDALRIEPHPTHFSLAEALEVIERVRPRRAYLTHLTHDMDHEATQKMLPPGVEVAYDGLVVDL